MIEILIIILQFFAYSFLIAAAVKELWRAYETNINLNFDLDKLIFNEDFIKKVAQAYRDLVEKRRKQDEEAFGRSFDTEEVT